LELGLDPLALPAGGELAGLSSRVGSSGTALGRGGETDAGATGSSTRGDTGASIDGVDGSPTEGTAEGASTGPGPISMVVLGIAEVVDPQFPVGQLLGINTGRLTRIRGEANTGRIDERR